MVRVISWYQKWDPLPPWRHWMLHNWGACSSKIRGCSMNWVLESSYVSIGVSTTEVYVQRTVQLSNKWPQQWEHLRLNGTVGLERSSYRTRWRKFWSDRTWGKSAALPHRITGLNQHIIRNPFLVGLHKPWTLGLYPEGGALWVRDPILRPSRHRRSQYWKRESIPKGNKHDISEIIILGPTSDIRAVQSSTSSGSLRTLRAANLKYTEIVATMWRIIHTASVALRTGCIAAMSWQEE